MHPLERLREREHLLHMRTRVRRRFRQLRLWDLLALGHSERLVERAGVLDGPLDPMFRRQ